MKDTLIQKKGTPKISEEVKVNGSNIVVYETYDYDKFNDLFGNREVNTLHVNHLVKSMREEYLIVPIIVNEKFEVIDGQHRLEACKQLEYPVYYIIVKGYGLRQTQMLNANSSDWSYGHYLDSFCKQGIFDYQELARYMKRYGFGYQDSMMILSGSQGTARQGVLFKNGKFKIGDLTKAQKIGKMILDFESYYQDCRRSNFVRAFHHILRNVKNYDHSRMMQKIEYQGAKIMHSSDSSGFLKYLEDIYNTRVPLEEKVRFF